MCLKDLRGAPHTLGTAYILILVCNVGRPFRLHCPIHANIYLFLLSECLNYTLRVYAESWNEVLDGSKDTRIADLESGVRHTAPLPLVILLLIFAEYNVLSTDPYHS